MLNVYNLLLKWHWKSSRFNNKSNVSVKLLFSAAFCISQNTRSLYHQLLPQIQHSHYCKRVIIGNKYQDISCSHKVNKLDQNCRDSSPFLGHDIMFTAMRRWCQRASIFIILLPSNCELSSLCGSHTGTRALVASVVFPRLYFPGGLLAY